MQVGWLNILETGTVTVTSEATGYNSYRLYDRIFGAGRPWKATSTATQTIQIDQGVSPVTFDSLVIPSGHLLSGCTFAFEGGATGSSWSTIVTGWTQSGSGEILKTSAAPVSHRYVRVVISGASVAEEAAEIYITLLNTLPNPIYGATRSFRNSLARTEGMDGTPRFNVNGISRKRLSGTITTDQSSEKSIIDAWRLHWSDYARPFYVVDHNSGTGWYEFSEETEIVEREVSQYQCSINLLQVF